MRLRRWLPFVTTLLVAACSDGTAPSRETESRQLFMLADEARDGGNVQRAYALDAAGAIVRGGASIRSLSVTLDGETALWRAVAWESRAELPLESSAFIPPVRVLVAWKGDDAATALYAMMWGDEGQFGGASDVDPDEEPVPVFYQGSAILSEGPLRLWMVESGDFEMTLAGEGLPCPASAYEPVHSGALSCRRARFDVSMNAVFAPVPGTDPTRSHAAVPRTVSLSGRVAGVRFRLRCDQAPSTCSSLLPLPAR